MRNVQYLCILFMVTCISCSRTPEMLETHFSAQLTVADSIDNTGDFSGFEFLIYNRLNANDPIDTLFFGETDTTGLLKGVIPFQSPGAYPN